MNPVCQALNRKLENPPYEKMIQIANEEGRCRNIYCWVIPIHYKEVLIEYAWYFHRAAYQYIVIYKDLTVFDDGYDTNIIHGYHYMNGKKYQIEDNYIGSMSSTRFISHIPGSPLYEFREQEYLDEST